MKMFIVIGRGHSGTRAISHTLGQSGVFMGEPLNQSGDLVPPDDMYEACRVMSRHVVHRGDLNWDFSKLHTTPIDPAFSRLIESYLASVLDSDAELKGWKIPETTLALPWIVRMFPESRYIFWVRNPRDCILGEHVTDDLGRFGIEYPQTDDVRLRRAISWKYQHDLVKATPKPARWIEVRFEDFVLDQDRSLERLEGFLDIRLAKVPVLREAAGRWRHDPGVNCFDFLAPAMQEYGYQAPDGDHVTGPDGLHRRTPESQARQARARNAP